jgi:hypothetical protein
MTLPGQSTSLCDHVVSGCSRAEVSKSVRYAMPRTSPELVAGVQEKRHRLRPAVAHEVTAEEIRLLA